MGRFGGDDGTKRSGVFVGFEPFDRMRAATGKLLGEADAPDDVGPAGPTGD